VGNPAHQVWSRNTRVKKDPLRTALWRTLSKEHGRPGKTPPHAGWRPPQGCLKTRGGGHPEAQYKPPGGGAQKGPLGPQNAGPPGMGKNTLWGGGPTLEKRLFKRGIKNPWPPEKREEPPIFERPQKEEKTPGVWWGPNTLQKKGEPQNSPWFLGV